VHEEISSRLRPEAEAGAEQRGSEEARSPREPFDRSQREPRHVRNGVRPLVLRSCYDAWIVAETARRLAGRRALAAPRTFRDIMRDVKSSAGARKPLAHVPPPRPAQRAPGRPG